MQRKFRYCEVVCLFVMMLLLSGCGSNYQKSVNSSVEKKVPELPPKELALEISREEFKNAYNKVALERNVPKLQVKEFEYGEGKDRTKFWYKFVRGFYLLGTIDDETGYIKSVCVANKLTLSGNDRKAQVQTTAYVFLMIIQTLSPELNADERAKIISKFADSSKKYIKVDSEKIEYEHVLDEDGKVLMLNATIKEKNSN